MSVSGMRSVAEGARRLALIYALLDGRKKIGPEHLNAALALWDYTARSATWALGQATGDPLAEHMHTALAAHPAGSPAPRSATSANAAPRQPRRTSTGHPRHRRPRPTPTHPHRRPTAELWTAVQTGRRHSPQCPRGWRLPARGCRPPATDGRRNGHGRGSHPNSHLSFGRSVVHPRSRAPVNGLTLHGRGCSANCATRPASQSSDLRQGDFPACTTCAMRSCSARCCVGIATALMSPRNCRLLAKLEPERTAERQVLLCGLAERAHEFTSGHASASGLSLSRSTRA
jgi:hypothetical protein